MAEAALKEVQKKVHSVLQGQIGLAESKRQDWVVDVGKEVDPSELINPEFWSHVAERFTSLDKIEVRWEDHSKIITLRVIWCERAYAKVKVISEESFEEAIPDAAELASDKFEVVWKGPTLRYCVIRKSDNKVLQDRFQDKVLAYNWIREIQ